MTATLQFLGAAKNVTGSRHLFKVNGLNLLVDCGLYQERQFRDRNWDKLPVAPSEIDAVFLTHAHLDHCGYLPKLVKDGFNGRVYCTPATAEIVRIILLDSAKIQEEDAAKKLKRHEREGRKGPHPEVPLYTIEDAEKTFPLFETVRYRQEIRPGAGIKVLFHDAGHVLGSSIIKMVFQDEDEERAILFSGDIGRNDHPILQDPTVCEKADYVLIESTYGDREHEPTQDIKDKIGEVLRRTFEAGGNVVVPSFALERSQELLYYINELVNEGKLDRPKVFLDSPMASKITDVFKNHPELFDDEMSEYIEMNRSPFTLPGLEMAGSAEESKKINDINSGAVIIAGSGMCTGGRIKHHLINNIERPECTVMFVGYQAEGTLGRLLVDGAKKARILGSMFPVNAAIERIHGFSAHADKNELLEWLTQMKTTPRHVFVVHGEHDAAEKFGHFLTEKTQWRVTVPEYLQKIDLD
ncbi:MAG: MBL fold metallo-hydrolase [Verrucomicrobia bacterium]|nr:MBL fold metallo-hydrolase [Verrucomicrobiota bacterium]MCF7708961.1 MBL fold metallo-hydrolase [Verrucomicrobiota bacterium]